MNKKFELILFLCVIFQIKAAKIAIIGLHDKKYDYIGKYAHYNKKKYAEKHGYDLFLYNEAFDKTIPAYWSKILAAEYNLSKYDWIFWLDSDALIMNDKIKLEDIIDDRFNFITTRDCLNYVNSGQWLIKNSQWSKDFLKKWFSLLYTTEDNVGGDNGALIKLYKSSEELRKLIKVLPQRMLSSYINCPLFYKIDGQYTDGDFVIHFAGIDNKIELMKKYFALIHPQIVLN